MLFRIKRKKMKKKDESRTENRRRTDRKRRDRKEKKDKKKRLILVSWSGLENKGVRKKERTRPGRPSYKTQK